MLECDCIKSPRSIILLMKWSQDDIRSTEVIVKAIEGEKGTGIL
jgi:hypothetical protein